MIKGLRFKAETRSGEERTETDGRGEGKDKERGGRREVAPQCKIVRSLM